MRMIRLTDAINAVEEVFKFRHGWRCEQVEERFPYKDSEETPIARLLKMYSDYIMESLINAEHVEVDKNDLERLDRLGLWKDACKIYVKHHANQILEDFKQQVEAQNDTISTS